MEARVVELQSQDVREVDPAAHLLGRLPVRQVEHELQDAYRGQLRR
jgi:hypothetical protein